MVARDFSAEGYSRRKVESHSWAWQFLCMALKGHDLKHRRGATSPRQVWMLLDDWYMPQTQGRFRELYRQFAEKRMSENDNPATFKTELEVFSERLNSKGVPISQNEFFTRFLNALSFPE